MITLDCERKESALDSVSLIYAVPMDKVLGFLRETDFDSYNDKWHADATRRPAGVLAELFVKRFSRTPPQVERVYWFHMTRTLPGETFSEGLLPLRDKIHGIWDTVQRVFRGTEHEDNLLAIKAQGIQDQRHTSRLANGGPFAVLVKESAFIAGDLNHYLCLPETMQEICVTYKRDYKQDISGQLASGLVPTIVKYWTHEDSAQRCTEVAALRYVCWAHTGRERYSPNLLFDGENSPIPAQQIVCVDRSDCALVPGPTRTPPSATAKYNVKPTGNDVNL